MGSKSNPLELSLSLKPSYVPKTISDLLSDLDKIDNLEKKLSVLNDYLNKYKEELSKVEALKRDLPQCMLLLMDAIEIMKDEITKSTKKQQGDQESESDHDEAQRRVSEFLTCKKRSYENDEIQMKNIIINDNISENKYSFGQHGHINDVLHWNPYYHDQLQRTQSHNFGEKGKEKDDQTTDYDLSPESRNKNKNPKMGLDLIKNGGTNFVTGKNIDNIGGFGGGLVLQNNQLMEPEAEAFPDPIWRNTNRRTWTAELHAKFVQALGHLKGPDVATPKQIRELMNVEGLTNDQVKSHLQKYRLHVRGIPHSSTTSDQINGSDYPAAATPRYDQAYYRAINKWLNPGAEASDHSNSAAAHGAIITAADSIGGGAAVAAAATTMENEKNNVVDDNEPADLNFGSWLSPFGSSGI